MATATLPTGTATFLYTDLEGSTRQWEQHSAQMPRADLLGPDADVIDLAQARREFQHDAARADIARSIRNTGDTNAASDADDHT
jgi:class 3 adenylate cyclase